MFLLPVLDVLGGVAVHGIGGRRDEYRPLVSTLTPGSDPCAIARAYRERLGTDALYLADLDAIMHGRPNHALVEQLVAAGTRLWLDAGFHHPAELPLDAMNAGRLILGLESWIDPATLPRAVASCGAERLVFSVDLKAGRPCGGPAWPSDPHAVIEMVLAAGIRQLILLDLADVGQSTGGSTQELCRWVRQVGPEVTIVTGGGVRGPDDVQRWQTFGIDGLLVASAVHAGTL